MTTATAVSESTPIENVVVSPRAQKALVGAGIKTVGDARRATMQRIATIPYVGEVTVHVLEEAVLSLAAPDAPLPPKIPVVTSEVEEGPFPLILESRYGRFRFPMRRAIRHLSQTTGETEVDAPLWVEFDEVEKGSGGQAKVTSLMWFLRKHQGDRVKAESDVEKGTPWRVDCAAWLRTRNSYRSHSWHILSD